MLQAFTYQSEEFPIFTDDVDPTKSKWHIDNPELNYASKVHALICKLRVPSVIWAYPGEDRAKNWEAKKPVEYELQTERVVAYVDDKLWWEFVQDADVCADGFTEFSTTPRQYSETSLLIPTPLQRGEVLWRREYRGQRGKRELICEIPGSEIS